MTHNQYLNLCCSVTREIRNAMWKNQQAFDGNAISAEIFQNIYRGDPHSFRR